MNEDGGGVIYMKRVLSMAFVILYLACFLTAGSAESYDLSELSDNALTKLYGLLRQEMEDRGLLEPKSY